MIAADIMRKDVVTVHEAQTVRELIQLLQDHRITGAPVLGSGGRVVGVVSQTDLVRREREQGEAHEAAPVYHQEMDRWLGRQGFQVEAPEYASVRSIMTPTVLAADPDTPIEELARMMVEKKVHRLIISRRGKLCGIVTSMDLLNAFLALGAARHRV